MNPKCSVIINTFNRPYMLKQAVASILCQTMDNWELILAVDHHEYFYSTLGITDAAVALEAECFATAEELADSDTRIKLDFTDLERGDQSLNRFAHNINKAFKLCTGDYISYLCDDDLFTPWRLSVMAQVLDANPEYQVVYCEQLVYDIPKNAFIEKRAASEILPQHENGANAPYKVNHNSIMHRRECFDAVGGWVENAPARLGDAYFFARLNQKWPFYPIDAVGEVMRMGEQNCWSGKPQSQAEKEQVGAFA
jgi:spore maturation protein CgeD